METSKTDNIITSKSDSSFFGDSAIVEADRHTNNHNKNTDHNIPAFNCKEWTKRNKKILFLCIGATTAITVAAFLLISKPSHDPTPTAEPSPPGTG